MKKRYSVRKSSPMKKSYKVRKNYPGKVTKWKKLQSEKKYQAWKKLIKVREVKIIKEVKRCDSLKCFVCGIIFYNCAFVTFPSLRIPVCEKKFSNWGKSSVSRSISANVKFELISNWIRLLMWFRVFSSPNLETANLINNIPFGRVVAVVLWIS